MYEIANKLCEEIAKLGGEALIVGGAVRDKILGNTINDIDIATSVPIALLFQHFETVDIGRSKDFGIVAVKYLGECFEVSNYRLDDKSEDHRHPTSVSMANSFKEDSLRRDFTINAMALDVNGKILDYHDGINDLHNKVIKTVGDPNERFKEDALRIIRAARFAAKLNFDICNDTLMSAIDNVHLIKHLSAERINGELIKSAGSGKCLASFIEHLDNIGALEILLPEIKCMQSCEHSAETHPEGGVYDHTLAALRSSKSYNPLINIAILFHDVGKPSVKDYKGKRITYYGHDTVGVKVWENIASRLKFSNDYKKAVSFAIINHMKMHKTANLKNNKLIKIRHDDNWEVLKEVIYADDGCRGSQFDLSSLNDRMKTIDELYQKFGEKKEYEEKMSKFIDGHKVISAAKKLEISLKGPDIGRIKNKIRSIVADHEFKISVEEVDKILEKLVVGGSDAQEDN